MASMGVMREARQAGYRPATVAITMAVTMLATIKPRRELEPELEPRQQVIEDLHSR